jgi:hypothetical protein
MFFTTRSRLIVSLVFGLLGHAALGAEPAAAPAFWDVDQLKVGQKGYGVTVMKGVKLEQFQVEILGLLKNTSPGRDMVLCRLAGLDLEKSGVIQGMSGSPVYVENKLVGAVAYAWPYGKEPIAGVTPFSQMRGFAESFERRNLASQQAPIRVGLNEPIRVDGKSYEAVTVAQDFRAPKQEQSEELCMVPLRAPLAASGMSANALRALREQFPEFTVSPVQGGAANAAAVDEAKDTKIVPGAALTVALMTGDFDMSGIGTVTAVEGNRVYGWGHPFMSLGGCELPLMTGWVHTVYPRSSISFKMGSPLKQVGVINADVSTGIAGWLGREADMLPMTMRVHHEQGGDPHSFKVKIARQKQMLPALVFTALTNSIDMEGDLPEEMTISFTCKIEVEGREPIILKDMFAGTSYSGGKAPSSLFSPVSAFVSQMLNNPFKPVKIARIECDTEIRAGRDAADIEGIELENDTVAPGETLRGSVYLRPFRGRLVKVPVALKLPADMPEGTYPLTALDEASAARQELRSKPHLLIPQDEDHMLEALRLLTSAKRTNLVIRVPLPADGVALDGKPLADLPPSMVQILGQTRRAPVLTMAGAASAKEPTSWVLYGTETVKFTVSRAKRATLTRD